MSTLKEIEDAIRALPVAEQEQLIEDLPAIIPAFNGDLEWKRIIEDPTPSPALDELIDSVDAQMRANPSKFQKLSEEEFRRHS